MYSNTDTKSITASERQYLFPDSTSYYSSDSNSRDKGNNVRATSACSGSPTRSIR